MNKIGLAMMVLLLVCGIAGAATVFMDSDTDETLVAYHGNGGNDHGTETYFVSNTLVSPCLFVNGEMSFYVWNTEPDATGDFYSPDKPSDSDRLSLSGVKDLYAVWMYSFSGDVNSFSTDSKYVTSALINNSSILDIQPIAGIEAYLDPSSSSARMQFSVNDSDVTWTFDPDSYTVTGKSADYQYTVTFTDVAGAHDFRIGESTGTAVYIDFDYETNVNIDLSWSSASL